MKTTLPNGPREPALVQMIEYIRDPYGYFERLWAAHGDVFTIRLPGLGEQVVVASPEGLKTVTAGGYETHQRMGEVLRYLLGGHALIFQDGMPHRRMRKLMGPTFQGERMRSYGAAMLRVTDDVLSELREGETVALRPLMQEITIRVILHCIFGLDAGPRFDRLRTLLIEFMDGMLTPWAFMAGLLFSGQRVLGLLERLGEDQRHARPDEQKALSRMPVLSQADRLGAIDALLFDEIERCRARPEGREDILALLATARDEAGKPLGLFELRDQLIMLMVGGHETSANSLCWAFYQLALHPEVCRAIREEEARVFPDGFDATRAMQLPYLGGVIQESMRLMPIAIGVARKLKEDTWVDGYLLPKGTQVMPGGFLAQRHPALWEKPEAFDPTRFVGKKPPIHAHFPFGVGVWRCLGAAFADYEMRIVLSRFVRRFDFQLAPGQVPKPLLQGITITPVDGMPLRLVRPAQSRALSALRGPGAQDEMI